MMVSLYKIAKAQARALRVRDEDVEDVVQESVLAMLKAIEKLDPEREARSQRSFLKTTAHNAAVTYLRKSNRTHSVEVLTDPSAINPPTASAQDEAIARETGREIEDVFSAGLERMSPRERSLFLEKLGLGGDMTLSELHSGTRGTYSHRARKKLLAASEALGCREALGEREFAALFAR